MVVPLIIIAVLALTGMMANNAVQEADTSWGEIIQSPVQEIEKVTKTVMRQEDADCGTLRQGIENPMGCMEQVRERLELFDSSDAPFEKLTLQCGHIFARVDRGERTEVQLFQRAEGHPTCSCVRDLSYYADFDFSQLESEDDYIEFALGNFDCEPEIAKEGLKTWAISKFGNDN